jgi:hypothetical protein
MGFERFENGFGGGSGRSAVEGISLGFDGGGGRNAVEGIPLGFGGGRGASATGFFERRLKQEPMTTENI